MYYRARLLHPNPDVADLMGPGLRTVENVVAWCRLFEVDAEILDADDFSVVGHAHFVRQDQLTNLS